MYAVLSSSLPAAILASRKSIETIFVPYFSAFRTCDTTVGCMSESGGRPSILGSNSSSQIRKGPNLRALFAISERPRRRRENRPVCAPIPARRAGS